MSHSFAELKKLTLDELIECHDKSAQSTSVGINYYLDEIRYRYQQKQTNVMLNYTRSVRTMTIIITLCTIINLGLILYSVIK